MNICVVSPSYPSPTDNRYPFVENLCNAFSDLGHVVYVITPVPLFKRKCPYKRLSYQSINGKVIVYSPKFLPLGRIPCLGVKFNLFFIRKSIDNTIKKNHLNIDVMYGHFWRSGLNAFDAAKKRNIPLFVATGESEIVIQDTQLTYIQEFVKYVRGVVCVSTKNKNESVKLGLTSEDKCVVYPNAINHKVFCKRDKKSLRIKYGFDENDFIVIFVGYFIKRKGAGRLAKAIKLLNNKRVKSIYIGKIASPDPEVPDGDDILFVGQQPQIVVSELLNCADVFVLPTLKEGCCNAIIEALACGLPVVSSDREFNYDILNSSNSILIDPNSVQQISKAIEQLYLDKDLRARLSKGAELSTRDSTISSRASKIIDFFSYKMSGLK